MTESGSNSSVDSDLFWGGPKATSVNDSEDSTENGLKKILVYHDCRDVTDSGDESNEVQETTESIMRGIKKASDNIAHATNTADRHRRRSELDPNPSRSKGNDPVTVAGPFPPLVDAAAQSERRELI